MIPNVKQAITTALTATALMGAASAHANFVMNNTGLASPTTTITFSEPPLAQGELVSNQYASSGLTFSGPVQFVPGSISIALSSDRVGSAFFGLPYSVTMSFGAVVSGAAFEFGMPSPYGGAMFALLGGNVVETGFVSGTGQPGSFFGFDNSAFDSIRLDFPGAGVTMEMDNVQIRQMASAVPEPETYALMLAGLGLLGFAARRRKQAQEA